MDLDVAPTARGLAEFLGSPTFDLASRLIEDKAVVFSGFHISEDGLEPILDLLLADRLAYVHGNSPRTKVGANVYTSTEYPGEFTISMHNELSYNAQWPARLCFFCVTPAETGGATPVLDAALWLDSLDDEVRTAYQGGVRYTQNLCDGFGPGKSWQATFETEDRETVEKLLTAAPVEWEWRRGGTLRISQTRPSTTRHPVTGTEVWFNQSDQWHPAALGKAGAALVKVLPFDQLPQSVTFADGTPIPDAYVLQVRDRGLAAAVDVEWRAGDLMLIDNVLVAHGRRPYSGSRRVLVAMSN